MISPAPSQFRKNIGIDDVRGKCERIAGAAMVVAS
jgi:hypothetical protein